MTDSPSSHQQEPTPYREVFSRSPAPALITDDEGTILESNVRAQTIFGIQHTSIQGLNLLDLLSTEGIEGLELGVRRWLIPSPGGEVGERKARTRKGIPLHLRCVRIAFKGRDALLLHLRDLSDHLARERSILEGRERFEYLLQQMHEGVWTVDPGGATVYVNPSLAQLLGRTPSEMILRPITKFLHPSNALATLSPMEFLTHVAGGRTEVHFLHADGREIPCQVRANRMDHLSSLRDGYLLSIEDLSETISLQQQLFQAQKLEAFGRLVGGIAHDFNNLLMALMGQAELVRDELPPDTRLRGDVETIIEVGQQGASMVKQLLMFSRKESIHGELIDARTWLHRAYGLVERLIPKGIKFTLEIEEQPLFFEGNPGHLDNVLMNLVINARDAIGERGHILLKAESRIPTKAEWKQLVQLPQDSSERMICVSVHDDGSGMEKEVLERIFEPFFSTKTKEKGTGLGLSTAYGLVKRQNGSIAVETELGVGSTFKLFFPQSNPPQQGEEPIPSPAPEEHSATPARILLVEDEAPVRKVTTQMLTHLKRSVVEAMTAEEALDHLEADSGEGFELVICDIVLPRMNGAELLKRIHERNPDQAVAFITGCSPSEVSQFGIPPDIPVLHKPFRLAQIRELLQNT